MRVDEVEYEGGFVDTEAAVVEGESGMSDSASEAWREGCGRCEGTELREGIERSEGSLDMGGGGFRSRSGGSEP